MSLTTLAVDDLSQYNIPTSNQTAAANFLRSDANVARTFADVFGLADADPRITLKAAQLAAIAVFQESADVVAAVSPKIADYRKYLENQAAKMAPVVAPIVVEASAPEASAPEASAPEASAPEASAPEADLITPPQKRKPGRPRKDPNDTAPRKAYVPTGKGRGRPKTAETAYDRCVVWARTNGYLNATSKEERNALTRALTANFVEVAPGSVCAYVSLMFSKGALKLVEVTAEEPQSESTEVASEGENSPNPAE